MTTYEYINNWTDFWGKFDTIETMVVSNSSEPSPNALYQTIHPHPTNCPNCGAPLKTGTCEYCDSKIY